MNRREERKMKILVIDSTISTNSMTDKILSMALKEINAKGCGELLETLRLDEHKDEIHPLDSIFLKKRTDLVKRGDYSDPIFNFAKKLREADLLLIAAPFYDLSVPALLKCFIEMTMIDGLTFIDKGDHAEGLLKAKKMLFLYASGYPLGEKNPDFASTWLEGIAAMWGIKGFDSYHLTYREAASIKETPDVLREKVDWFLR